MIRHFLKYECQRITIVNYWNYHLESYKIVRNSIIIELLQKSAIFYVFDRFRPDIDYHYDDFENFSTHSLPTRCRNFIDVEITICYEQTQFFRGFFFEAAILNSCVDETQF